MVGHRRSLAGRRSALKLYLARQPGTWSERFTAYDEASTMYFQRPTVKAGSWRLDCSNRSCSVVCPDQNQSFNDLTDWRALWDNEENSRARAARREKRGKGFRHRPLVVAYKNSVLRCREA